MYSIVIGPITGTQIKFAAPFNISAKNVIPTHTRTSTAIMISLAYFPIRV